MGNMHEIEIENMDWLSQAPAISTPLSQLCAQYQHKREAIERIARFVQGEGGVIDYFMTGAQQTHGYSTINMATLFQAAPALRALDAHFWDQAFRLTDLLEIMPAKRRNEWQEMIRSGFVEKRVPREDRWGGYQTVREPIPPFSEENVRSTLEALLAQRSQLFAERASGLWDSLSTVHLTNQPQAFSKRMILRRVISYYGQLDFDMANYIHDLRKVIATFMGRDCPLANITHDQLSSIVSDVVRGNGSGKWHAFDGGAWSIRLYKIGTAHLLIHPELAWRLNAVLASIYPMAIPSEFRKKPARERKIAPLTYRLIPFQVLGELKSGSLSNDTRKLLFSRAAALSKQAIEVLQFIGGIRSGSEWQFSYPVANVIAAILRTGQLPDAQSHQFYPTPEDLARELVEWADIQPGESVVEPSAGQAGIAQFLPKECTTCIELSELHVKILESKGFRVVQGDFLEWFPDAPVDVFVMNPPFNQGEAVAHVQHAARLLSPAGRLLSILPASLRGSELVSGMQHEWSDIKDGRFPGTSVSVVFLKLSTNR